VAGVRADASTFEHVEPDQSLWGRSRDFDWGD